MDPAKSNYCGAICALSTAHDAAQTNPPSPTTSPANTTENKKPLDKVEVPFVLIGNDTRSANVKSILMHRAIELKHRQIGERYLVAVTTPEFRLEKSKLMYLTDPLTRRKFLIDSGCEISVIPRSPSDRLDEKVKFKSRSANGTAIRTYDTKVVKIKVGSRYVKWTFVVADVTGPIMGIDFMKAHGLIIDSADNCLVDRVTSERIPCQTGFYYSKHRNRHSFADEINTFEELRNLTIVRSGYRKEFSDGNTLLVSNLNLTLNLPNLTRLVVKRERKYKKIKKLLIWTLKRLANLLFLI